MELGKTRKILFVSTLLWLFLTFCLGTWWMYLAFSMSELLEKHQIEHKPNIQLMLRWEGLFFFALLCVITLMIFFLIYRDGKKSQSVRAFFATFTHELKTPLTKVKLQAEILKSMIISKQFDSEKSLQKIDQLINGSNELEDEFDKMLQLARVEEQGQLNITAINIERFLKITSKEYEQKIEIDLQFKDENLDIFADQYALKVIFKNLFENTLRHSNPDKKKIKINVLRKDKEIIVSYKDLTSNFSGEVKKLGTLFYKHNSHQGTGLGLYIIKKLMQQMKGKFDLRLYKYQLQFRLTFRAQE